ncbi:MAG: hypothetical protein HY561_03435 [Gemmatimonadetes bacterium]|nr:hypothetical protein [Gemmatimonadota bacterium]
MPESLADRLEEGVQEIMLFLPQLAAALGILLAGYAVAKMVERGTDALLHRIGFDRWMREGGVTEALERAGTRLDPSTVLAKLIFWTVMLLVVLLAANAMGLVVVSALFRELLGYIPNVIAAVIVLVLGIVLGEFVKDLVLASAGGVPGVPTLARAAKGAVIILAVFMALEQLQIAQDIVLVAFIAVVGAAALAAGIAFGLGGRDIAAELAREWYERTRRRAAQVEASDPDEDSDPRPPRMTPPLPSGSPPQPPAPPVERGD